MYAPWKLLRNTLAPRATRRPPRAPARRCRPALEWLEDRCVPAVFNVNSLADILNPSPGVVTLRSAIQAANNTADPAGNVINLTIPGVYRITLAPTGNETDNAAGEFAILPTTNLTITNTSGGKVTVAGGGLSRVFDINPGNTDNPATHFLFTMQGFTIENGRAFDATGGNPDGAVASGGGIRDQGNESLTLTDMVITNNSATADGGGVSMENSIDTPWEFTVNNSTISDNQAGDAGGGLETDGSGRMFVNFCTVTGNTCVNQGAGIWLDAIGKDSAILFVTSSLVSANVALDGPTGGIGNAGDNIFVSPTGAITNGAVTITDSTVTNNFSGGTTTGGGGFGDQNSLGTLIILNSTFVGNSSTQSGGGIQENGPSTTINDSTVTGNVTLQEGGGLDITSPAFVLNNTIVAGNFSNGGTMNFLGVNPDVVGAVTTGNGNFIGIGAAGLTGITNGTNGNQIGTAATPLNPLLGPLQNNGGPTPTEAPLLGSPVIDKGVNSVIPAGTTTDQRGLLRIINAIVDIGAVEFQPPATTTFLSTSVNPVQDGQSVTFTAFVLANTPGSNPITGTVTFSIDGVPTATVALVNGMATFTTAALTPPNHTVTATYNGDANFTPSSQSLNEVVMPELPVLTAGLKKVHGKFLVQVFDDGALLQSLSLPSKPMIFKQDINGDGIPDLVIQFKKGKKMFRIAFNGATGAQL